MDFKKDSYEMAISYTPYSKYKVSFKSTLGKGGFTISGGYDTFEAALEAAKIMYENNFTEE